MLLCALFILPSCGPKRLPALPAARLDTIACRIVTITRTPNFSLTPLADVNLDTTSNDPAAQTFEAVIHDGRRLGARVRHVAIALPRDRFNVAMTLDGKTHLRMNHLDLDIYVETTIDGRVYALHCFPDFGIPEEVEGVGGGR